MTGDEAWDRLGETGEAAPDTAERLNVGHGVVVPRPDGTRARCGGPAACPQCKRDQNLVDALAASQGEGEGAPSWLREVREWAEGRAGRDPDARLLTGAPPRLAALLSEHLAVRSRAADPHAHPYDAGWSGRSDRCNSLVLRDGYGDDCGLPREHPSHGEDAGHAYEPGDGDMCRRPGCGRPLEDPAHGGTLRAAAAVVRDALDAAEASWRDAVEAGSTTSDDAHRSGLDDGLRLALAALAGRRGDWAPEPRPLRPTLRMPSLAADGDAPTLVAEDGTEYARAIFGPEGALAAWTPGGRFVSWGTAESLAAAVLREAEKSNQAREAADEERRISNKTRESGADRDRRRRAVALERLATDTAVPDAEFRRRVLASAARAVREADEADRLARLARLRERVEGA